MKQKKLLVIDGQGGRMGAALVSQCKAAGLAAEIIAVGANSAATTSMLKAGADAAATGENPVVVNGSTAAPGQVAMTITTIMRMKYLQAGEKKLLRSIQKKEFEQFLIHYLKKTPMSMELS